MNAEEAFDETLPRDIPTHEALTVTVDGFEGPLDLLLALARAQKVDLAKISILALADQYLAFVEQARRFNLELAADYLVMAAWLAYLKSRLLLPKAAPTADEASAEEMASLLRLRLQRLAQLREIAARLMARDRLGRDVFSRGDPEPISIVRRTTQTDTLYELLTAYATQRLKRAGTSASYKPAHLPILLIEEARARIERLLGRIGDWSALTRFLPMDWQGGARRRSALASTLLACLELTRDGRLEMRQLKPFDEIYIKDRAPEAVI